jgi:hypothetical protein
MVEVAVLAASAAAVPPVAKITATHRRSHTPGNHPAETDCVAERCSQLRTGLRSKFPANREINREFWGIRPSIAIFVSDQGAASIASSRIPYATEQGIFRRITGKNFAITGKRPFGGHTTRRGVTSQLKCEDSLWPEFGLIPGNAPLTGLEPVHRFIVPFGTCK